MKCLLLLLLLAAGQNLASANLVPAGPYALDMLEIGNCDDGEYPGLFLNISLVEDKEAMEVVYSGDAIYTYDFLADDCEMQITSYKWGSTGGWSRVIFLNFTKPYDYLKTNFPLAFEFFLESTGIDGKQVIPGTYYVKRYKLLEFTFKKIPALPYGKYKSYFKGIKDGEPLLCIQTNSIVYEVPAS